MARLWLPLVFGAVLCASERSPRLGQAAYESTCARCHGADGKSTDYQYIKRLDGIGKRLTRTQVRERLPAVRHPGGGWLCRGTLFGEAEFEALVAYLMTL